MKATRITMDGTTYRVLVVYNSLARSFQLLEGPNAGDMLSFRHERDLGGTGYGYELSVEPDPKYPEDYDAFYDAVSAPVNSHTIKLPYGANTIIFDAMIESGSDTYKGRLGGRQRWGGLRIRYRYIEPQRVEQAVTQIYAPKGSLGYRGSDGKLYALKVVRA